MVRSCVLCQKKPRKNKVMLHAFPNDIEMRQQWARNCGVNASTDKHVFVCSNHFTPEDYKNASQWRRYLFPNAIPSLGLPLSSNSEPNSLSTTKRKRQEEPHCSLQAVATPMQPLQICVEVAVPKQPSPQIPAATVLSPQMLEMNPVKKRRFADPRFIQEIEISDMLTPAGAGRVLRMIKSTCAKKTAKIKQLTYKNRNLQSRFNRLEAQIQDLLSSSKVTKTPKNVIIDSSAVAAPFIGHICRTCMTEGQSFHSINDTGDGSIKICEILATAVPLLRIQANDQLPELICNACLYKLNNAYQFQQMCIATDQLLRAQLKTSASISAVNVADVVQHDPLLENSELLLSDCLKFEIAEEEVEEKTSQRNFNELPATYTIEELPETMPPLQDDQRNVVDLKCIKSEDSEDEFASEQSLQIENSCNVDNETNIVKIESDVLNSASASSEEEEKEICVLSPKRQSMTRVKNFIADVINLYTESEFKAHFRMQRESAEYLIERYANSSFCLKRAYKGGRPQQTPKAQMLMFLWFCSNKITIREVGTLFNMCLSNVHTQLNKVLSFMVEEIAEEVIQFPQDAAAKEAIANDFKTISGFPNVLGCIDGSYISVRTPKHNHKSTYINSQDSIAITLQGVCDANLKFWNVFFGVPSKMDDARVLQLSSIGSQLPILCQPEYHLLGDAAYPIRSYLLTPYRNCENLTEAERMYNLKFDETQVKIGNAFGMLKCRFQQLMRLDFHDVETMKKFVTACCALHNICIDKNDFYEILVSENNIKPESIKLEHLCDDANEVNLTEQGEIKRNQIKELLYENSRMC